MSNKLFKKLNIRLILMTICILFNMTAFAYAYYDDDYPVINSAYWEDRIARWDTIGYATRFEVVLYRNGHRVTTQMTTQDGMNMSRHMSNASGDYYFDVRPYNSYSGWGDWMASDCIYMEGRFYDDYYDRRYDDRYYNDRYYYEDRYRYNQDVSYAKNPGPPTNSIQNNSAIIMPNSGGSNVIMPGSSQQVTNQATGISVANRQTITVPAPQVLYQQANGESSLGKFVEAYGVWHYIYSNGFPATNAWVQYKNKWYYIDANGIMAVGLYTINGTTYYLQSDGSMAIGNFVIDGLTHYFDNNGAMLY